MLGKCVEYRILPVNCAGEEYVVENSDIRSKYFSKMILTYVRCGDDFHSKSGQIVARTANGVRQTYEYDGRGQLLAVKENGVHVERYAYDKAGNMLKKKILRSGRAGAPRTPQSDDYITTTFTFDDANQLVSSTTDGVTTRYAYDAAGRLVKEGSRTYRYGYLDKVLSVTDGDTTRTYTYHADGQLASASCDGIGRAGAPRTPQSETFLWDGLALVRRGDEQFVNEPHVGGGNPIASSKGVSYFNDMLGTTVGAKNGAKYSAAALTAFGETIENGSVRSTPTPSTYTSFYTGKPHVAGLGHAFLMRNYRAGLAKWQTADPIGYPDGWNQLAYCNNGVTGAVDLWGCKEVELIITTEWIYTLAAQNQFSGYTMADVFKYMKDQWNLGKDVMEALNIKTIEDLVKKESEGALTQEIKNRLKDILGSDNWLDKLLLADSSSCYSHVEPMENEILAAFRKATGRVSYDDRDAPVLASVKIDYDDENIGLRIIDGAKQVWKVKVRYE